MRKGLSWFIKYPGDGYALGPVHFDKKVGEKKVREWARNWSKVNRLPNGFQCWIADKNY